MKICFTHLLIFFIYLQSSGQGFIRSELSTSLNSPWEIIYGPDGFLWLTESGGKVSRVDPVSGSKTVVYTAPDYFPGSSLEQSPLCFQPSIGYGTLGMALHPNFLNGSTSYIYFVYSYNSGTATTPVTKFKIQRLKWNAAANSVVADTTLVPLMPTGYDHLGGRLMIIPQNGTPYLFFTVGDNGISETNSPTCYSSQSANPNNFAQDPNYKNGKVHRFNIDGSIPSSNPLPGNSFYTRGHRNPQGLMYNPSQQVIYEIEHGDRTDDEINILEPGMNYGWKFVRGFHSDNNYPGETAFVSAYTPYPGIANDALKEPLYAWCSTPQPTISTFLDWCTVAPSDGIYYGSTAIPDWTSSLLVVTLKNGSSSDQQVFRFKMNANGTGLVSSVPSDANPKTYFGADQNLNGRLRDITVSPDGTKVYLINNGGTDRDKITVYTYDATANLPTLSTKEFELELFPNPNDGILTIRCTEQIEWLKIGDLQGREIKNFNSNPLNLNVSELPVGCYLVSVQTLSGKRVFRKLLKN